MKIVVLKDENNLNGYVEADKLLQPILDKIEISNSEINKLEKLINDLIKSNTTLIEDNKSLKKELIDYNLKTTSELTILKNIINQLNESNTTLINDNKLLKEKISTYKLDIDKLVETKLLNVKKEVLIEVSNNRVNNILGNTIVEKDKKLGNFRYDAEKDIVRICSKKGWRDL